MSFKPVLAVGSALAGLYLAGTLSGALTEDEPVPPKVSDHRIEKPKPTLVWVEELTVPAPRRDRGGDHGSH